jgi:formyltetrahydrofolate synthetase
MGMNAAVGFVVVRNLAVFGEMSVTFAFDPSVKTTANGTSSSKTATDYDLSLMSAGAGVAYYFERLNLYVSGAFTFPWLVVENSSSDDSSSSSQMITKVGVGGNLMVGKEWWISANWALGGAGMVQVASAKMKDVDTHWSAAAVSLMLSATYN